MKRENEESMPQSLEWLLAKESPNKRRRLERIWKELPDAAAEEDVRPDVEEAWAELSRRLDERESATRTREITEYDLPAPASVMHDRKDRAAARRNRGDALRRRTGAAIAAVLTAGLIVTGLWILNRPVVIEARPGEHESVQLPDGSIVELNSDTRLEIASTFRSTFFAGSDRRRVALDGEAFFRVAEDARPFIVDTRDAELRVLGTEFNVHARDTAEGTKVTLVSGAVAVSARGAREAVTLDDPGAAAYVRSTSPVSVAASDEGPALDHVLAWRNRGFAFIDTPIGVILDEVERRFGLVLEPRTGVDREERMNLFYSRGVTPEQILSDICFEQDCRYRRTNRGYAIAPPATP